MALPHSITSVRAVFDETDEMTRAFKLFNKPLTSPLVLAFPGFDMPSVVETASIFVSFGVALAQKKEKARLHLVQYAIRTMFHLNYCTSEVLHLQARSACCYIHTDIASVVLFL